MYNRNDGLTVGELTMTIGALLIAGFLWSSIANKEERSPKSSYLFESGLKIERINKII